MLHPRWLPRRKVTLLGALFGAFFPLCMQLIMQSVRSNDSLSLILLIPHAVALAPASILTRLINKILVFFGARISEPGFWFSSIHQLWPLVALAMVVDAIIY